MSEFSESFHLRSDRQENGEDLLRRAGFSGAVFSAVRGWVTVVPESELYTAVAQMAASNEGLLLHYIYAEDHGWQFGLYKNNSIISQYECGWVEELAIDDSGLNQEVLVSVLIDESREQVLEDILNPPDLNAVIMEPPAYRFANLLGLEHYEWLSGGNFDGFEERDPNVIFVVI